MSATLPVLLLALVAPPAPGGLGARLAPLIRAHQGKVAVGVKDLDSGETFFHNPDAVMPTASLIKVAVLIEAYLQADEGKLSLRDRIRLRDADKVPGSGVLSRHFDEGTVLSVRTALRLMMGVSDNTATNLVLDRVGIAAVNRRLAKWGLKETRLNHKVFRGDSTSVDPARTKKYGLGSTTAREMVALFEAIETGNRLRPPLKQSVLGLLKKNDDRDKFTRLLPPDTVVAHKDGSLRDARTDAGILYTPAAPVVVCVLTAGNADQRWTPDNAGNLLCARVAKAVYDHFNAKRP
jgi:beta-lactamase class A